MGDCELYPCEEPMSIFHMYLCPSRFRATHKRNESPAVCCLQLRAEAAATTRPTLPSICRRRIPIKCKSGITSSFCFRELVVVQSPHERRPCPGEGVVQGKDGSERKHYPPNARTRHWHRIRMQFVLPQLILFMSLGYKYICEIAYLCSRCSFGSHRFTAPSSCCYYKNANMSLMLLLLLLLLLVLLLLQGLLQGSRVQRCGVFALFCVFSFLILAAFGLPLVCIVWPKY